MGNNREGPGELWPADRNFYQSSGEREPQVTSRLHKRGEMITAYYTLGTGYVFYITGVTPPLKGRLGPTPWEEGWQEQGNG